MTFQAVAQVTSGRREGHQGATLTERPSLGFESASQVLAEPRPCRAGRRRLRSVAVVMAEGTLGISHSITSCGTYGWLSVTPHEPAP